MKRLLAIVGATIAILASSFASAQTFICGSGATARLHNGVRSTKSPKLKEAYTLDTWSTDNLTVPVGMTADRSSVVTFTCKQACTVISQTSAQYAYGDDNNHFAVCPTVDGNPTNNSCLTEDGMPPDSNISLLTNISLPAGRHTAKVYFCSDNLVTTVGGRETDYRIYY